MASLLSRFVASFAAIAPVPNLTGLDGEHNQLVGAVGALNGNTTAFKLLIKTSDAADPPVAVDQIGAGPIFIGKQNGVTKITVENDGDLIVNGVTGAAGVYTFGSIPVGPASNPTTDNQLARKAYVDSRKTFWSASWFISDPSTFPLNSFALAQKACIPSSSFTVTLLNIVYSTGSASGSFTIEFRKHPFNSQAVETVLGSITVNPGAVGVGIGNDVVDTLLTFSDWVYPVLTARSSPLQRDISINMMGFQKPES